MTNTPIEDGLHRLRLPRADKGTVPKDKAKTSRRNMRPVTLRLPPDLIDRLKVLAQKRQRPYQTMARLFLAERLASEEAKS